MSKWIADLEKYRGAVDAHLKDNVVFRFAKFFDEFFRPAAIAGYEWSDFQKIGAHLHCFQSMALARQKALGSPNHDIEHYRKCFLALLDDQVSVATRIDRFEGDARYSVRFFGKSAISEICAYLFSSVVFMRNSRDVWAAERYGIEVAHARGATFGERLIAFGDAMRPLAADYERVVGRRSQLPLNLEVDQFISWAYQGQSGDIEIEQPPRGRNVWSMGCGANGDKWDDFRKNNIVALGLDGVGDLRQYANREEIAQKMREITGSTGSKTNDTLAAWQFTHEMQPGDTVIVKQGFRRLLAIGVITSDYEFDKKRPNYQNVRHVEWKKIGDWTLDESQAIASKTLTRATEWGTWLDMVMKMVGLAEGGVEVIEPRPAKSNYELVDALEGLFVAEASFIEMLEQLKLKKNVVLQGPPGVGKTFVAKRLAYTLMGEKDKTRIEMVQFHQSYAYEDFVQGLRPNSKGEFQLQDGVFYRFCKAAADDDRPRVFIIDEINRGNLSRILGELMMLLEADKRGPDWSVSLTYGGDGDRFHVPANVYIIGTMNTADRSLAMVDYALRRRFAFLTLDPAFGLDAFLEYLEANGTPEPLVHKINARLLALNARIQADTKNLGAGFRVGHSYFCPAEEEAPTEEWYRRVIRYEIIPLLEEYWFDDSKKLQQACDELLAP